MNKPPLLDAIRTIYATVFVCALGAMTSAEAVTITAISGNYQLNGFLTTPDEAVQFDETVVSTSAEDTIILAHSLSSNHSLSSSISNNILNGTNPRIAGSVFGRVRSPGVDFYSLASFSYELVFSIDVAADFSLFNITSAGFPAVQSDNGNANINISLKHLDDSTIFSYDAPAIGNAGTYALGTILAGSYKFLIDGSVEAIGLPPSPPNPFSPLVNGQSIAEVSLGFSDAAVVPLPATIWLFGSGLLGLIGMARRKESA